MSDVKTLLFALPGYRVLNVTSAPDGGRVVLIEGAEAEGGCSVSSADFGAEQLCSVSPLASNERRSLHRADAVSETDLEEHPRIGRTLNPETARAMWAQRIATVEAQGLSAIADMVMERYFTAAFRVANPDAVAAFRRGLLRTDPAGYVGCCHAVANVDWLDALQQVKCPTLIIAGAQDVGAPVAMSQAMAERIPGAQLVVLDAASHLSVAEQPMLFAQHLDQFLSGLALCPA